MSEIEPIKFGVITTQELHKNMEQNHIGVWDVVLKKDITEEYYWKNVHCEQNSIIGLA